MNQEDINDLMWKSLPDWRKDQLLMQQSNLSLVTKLQCSRANEQALKKEIAGLHKYINIINENIITFVESVYGSNKELTKLKINEIGINSIKTLRPFTVE